MKLPQMLKKARQFVAPYRITDGKGFRLKQVAPGDTGGLPSEARPQAQELLRHGVEAMARLQEMRYAQDRWAVLVIFQAMDAADPDTCRTREVDPDYLEHCRREQAEQLELPW